MVVRRRRKARGKGGGSRSGKTSDSVLGPGS